LGESVMKLCRRQFLRLATIAAALPISIALLVCDGDARSQTARTIKIVVPFPPGGAADFMVRSLAEQISRALAVTTVVENRPGAGSVIGTEAVSRASSDGNTLLVVANS